MALKAGTAADFGNSMAEAIQNAFRNEWPNIIGGEAPSPTDQMKLLFIAVAKGVIEHLVKNPEAFVITLPEETDHAYKFKVEINGT